MKNKFLFILTISLLSACLSGCDSCKHEYDELVVSKDSCWQTFITGSDFNDDGLEVSLKCSLCNKKKKVKYTLENNTSLTKDQKSVTIKYQEYSLEYPIVVKDEYHIACVGDSLTAGHNWADKAYPVYLSSLIDSNYKVENCGVNGISITGYGGSWKNPDMRYIKQSVYQKSINFEPDVFAIMLGTNDATQWSLAEPTFNDEYHILLDSYIELFPRAKFIMMVSPPVVYPNQFDIPNDEIRDCVNPIQRDLAEEYGFELLDLRKEFEETDDYQTRFLRPNYDNVHFTEEGAQYVAQRVWDIAKELTF